MSGLLLHSSSVASVPFGGIGKLNQERNHNSILSSKKSMRGSYLRLGCNNSRNSVRAFFFNPAEDPVLKEALKEPVAFAGGLFAGLLRLDLNEEPLKEWVKRTVESAGITEEDDTHTRASAAEDGPTEIEIE
ncbi:UPF0426 protein At1g28150, chloroplastic [Momordica charantia]|uniref:UPF0426 protein At1g28150, chloroplastic n=1 Tax=Momordica charantia TaxID=3673 RepID=A0A6J1C844_MOMCH|nr:UPF0426 protein At1g28150, chloroplastic [Momordica charantia]